MELSEAQLIDSVLSGETQGYRDMVERYGQQVQLVVAQMVEDVEDVAELTQDVFVKVFESMEQYDASRASLSTWMSRIAYNVAANHLRRWRPKVVRLAEETLEFLVYSDYQESSDNPEIADLRIEFLDEAIGRLRPEERLLVYLKYYEGRSLAEISYVMDVREGALASRLKRIRHKLKRLIKILEHETDV